MVAKMKEPRKGAKKEMENVTQEVGPVIISQIPQIEIRAFCGRYKDLCDNKISKENCEQSQRREGCRYARIGLYVKFD